MVWRFAKNRPPKESNHRAVYARRLAPVLLDRTGPSAVIRPPRPQDEPPTSATPCPAHLPKSPWTACKRPAALPRLPANRSMTRRSPGLDVELAIRSQIDTASAIHMPPRATASFNSRTSQVVRGSIPWRLAGLQAHFVSVSGLPWPARSPKAPQPSQRPTGNAQKPSPRRR